MSYAGTYEPCPHGGYRPNCVACITARQEAVGVRDSSGVLHAPNGPGTGPYCVGHIEDGRCTTLVRHCPVLNTPEQLAANLAHDRRVEVTAARLRVERAQEELRDAECALIALEEA